MAEDEKKQSWITKKDKKKEIEQVDNAAPGEKQETETA